MPHFFKASSAKWKKSRPLFYNWKRNTSEMTKSHAKLSCFCLHFEEGKTREEKKFSLGPAAVKLMRPVNDLSGRLRLSFFTFFCFCFCFIFYFKSLSFHFKTRVRRPFAMKDADIVLYFLKMVLHSDLIWHQNIIKDKELQYFHTNVI